LRMRGFWAVWNQNEIRKRLLDLEEECWTSLSAVIAGNRIRPFLDANDPVVA
jgi:hypothetical protein